MNEIRLIDANALKKLVQDTYANYNSNMSQVARPIEFTKMIDNAPTVEPEITNEDLQLAMTESHKLGYEMAKCKYERPQGEWIDDSPTSWECSNCGYGVERYNNTRFCPHCGAKMKGGAE